MCAPPRSCVQDDDVYLIDHYAGKPAVQALGEYFARNHAQLHPMWNSDHIRTVEVRMSETDTCESRIQFFHR